VILLKEAVAYLGQVKDERTERALINRVGEYEAALLKREASGLKTPNCCRSWTGSCSHWRVSARLPPSGQS